MKTVGIALAAVAFVILCLWTFSSVGPWIESDLDTRVRAALDEEGLRWAHVSPNGRDMRLSGVAPSEAARKVAGRITASIWGVNSVQDETTLARLAPVGAAPPRPDAVPRAANLPGGAAALAQRIADSRIYFKDARYGLSAEDRATLDSIVEALQDCTRARIEVAGHTDDLGPAEVNRRLSMDRARAAVDYLVSAGVASERISIGAYGESQPAEDNSSDAARARNRRIEFNVEGG